MKFCSQQQSGRYILAIATVVVLIFLGMNLSIAQPKSEASRLTEHLAEIMNTWEDDSDRVLPFEQLLQSAEKYRDASSGNASAWIVLGRVRFGYANTQGIVRGMRLIREARDELEQSIKLDPSAERGLGQALLGFLYVGTPPWPLGFRNTAKGLELLATAHELNRDGMEINYYYAQYYSSTKQFDKAIRHVEIAKEAALSDSVTPELRTFYLSEIGKLRENIERRQD